ncbi:MAG: Flp pilus assembly protein CpaB [Kiritimatiellaeota bacterium]|nr:Flp pilus assembly protein CpaB [Kiritimatiellota bacterium]
MKQKVLLIAAVAFGLLAFYLTYTQLQYEKNKLRAKTQKVELIKLRIPKTEGEVIEESDIMNFTAERFRSQRNDEVLWKNRFEILKQKADRSMLSGTILRYSDIRNDTSRRAGLAGVVKMDMRAISISVDATSSVSSMIKPEDNVDILGTFRFPEMKGDKSLDVVTLTILQSVRVLATGKELGNKRAGARRSRRTKGYSTITLELTPKEVEMIVFATQKGRLVLSLRSYNETGFEEKLQSVNFKFLQEHIKEYNKDRKRRQGLQ